MKKSLRVLMLILASFLAISMYGCDRDTEDEKVKLVKFISANPPSGSTLLPDSTLTVSFDGIPANLSATAGVVALARNTATISGPFTEGKFRLVLTWSDGSHTLLYTVKLTAAEASIPEGMVLIPAGEFEMGSNDAEAQNNEQPVHTVYVDAFYMDKHEVTNSEYKQFILANPQWQKEHIDANFHNGRYLVDWIGITYPKGRSNHPVTNVSWYAAMAYAQWAGKRLPTEAEWEYAARGGLEDQKYPWGNTITAKNANYDDHVGSTSAVGNYPANGYGLHDVAGNVWEWCLDEYDADFYSVSPHQNPLSGANSVNWIIDNFTNVKSLRVLRSGSRGFPEKYVRVAYRGRGSPMDAFANNGFRCAASVAP